MALASALGLQGCAPEVEDRPSAAEVVSQTKSVIYDNDDRLEPYEVGNPLVSARLLNSSVMLLRGGILDNRDPTAPRLNGQSLAEADNLCASERFGDQPAWGNCSGTLVGPTLVLLAAHCLVAQGCPQSAFVLAPAYDAPGQLATIGAGDVRRCVSVAVRRDVEDLDLAFVLLDAPFDRGQVAPTRPLSEPLMPDEALTLLGFPRGIPAKASPGAMVRLEGNRFATNVDAYEGNSGGGIFDRAGRLVGHLTRGNTDYVRQAECNVSRVLPGNGAQDLERAVLWSASLAVACEEGGEHLQQLNCAEVAGGSARGPEGWSCPPSAYADGLVCNCGCSLYDPDCDDPQAPIRGCNEGQTCTDEGACVLEGDTAAASDSGGCFASAASVLPLGGLFGLWGGWRRRRRVRVEKQS